MPVLRNIMQGGSHHNRHLGYRGYHADPTLKWPVGREYGISSWAHGRIVHGCLLLLLSALLAGCQGESQPPSDTTATRQEAASTQRQATGTVASDCIATVAWDAQDAYDGLARRLAEGKPVAETDFQAMCDDTDYALWLKTLQPSYVNWAIMRNVMTYLHAPPQAASEQPRRAPKRNELTENLTYVKEHTSDISRVIAEFTAEQRQCRVLEHLHGYLTPEQMPTKLTVSFLTLLPEIRYLEDHLIVDTGLAIAARPKLLTRLMASVIYRDIAAPAGRQPHENLPGEEALVATFQKLRFEGIASWLEDFANVSFDPDHPQLGKADKGRQDIQVRVAEVMDGVIRYLAIALRDDESLHLQGNLVDDVMRGAAGYGRTGYAMADLIVKEYGEQRLQEVSHQASAFLQSYQDAAIKLNATTEQTATRPLLPPFPAEDFEKVMKLLRKHGA